MKNGLFQVTLQKHNIILFHNSEDPAQYAHIQHDQGIHY